jgi:hypothetical protein
VSLSTGLLGLGQAAWPRRHHTGRQRPELSGAAFGRLAAALLAAQALVLAVVMSRGWFYNDDFALLMQASNRTPGWNYLKTPINDHLLPGLRMEFWLLRHSWPLNHPLTIGVRLLLQTGGTALLLLLLRTLAGRRRRVLLVTALYAFCPLVLTNSLWLTVALSLLPAQLLVLAALNAHVRHTATGELRWAVLAGLCLLGGALFWEKVAVSAVLLPILSLGYLHDGTTGQRLLASLRLWRGWLAAAVPIAAFTGYFLAAGYGGAATAVSPGDLTGVLWMQWSRLVGPSLLGGPWSWFKDPHVSLGYATAGTTVALLAQLGFVALVLLGIRLTGWKSLLAWSIPAAPLVLGTTLVALGRFAYFGQLIATTLRYGADLAAPLFLGLGLAIMPTSAAAIRRRLAPDTAVDQQALVDDSPAQPAVAGRPAVAEDSAAHPASVSQPTPEDPADQPVAAVGPGTGRLPTDGWSGSRRPPVAVLVAGLAAVLWLLGSLLSVADFDRHWAANPTHRYVDTLTADIAEAGPGLNLYDSTVSQAVLPIFFGPRWHLSDFLPLTGRVPVFDAPATEPLLADDQGVLRPAVLVPAATREPPAGGLCAYLASGAGTWRIPLDQPAPDGDGFLRIDYLQPRPSTADVTVEDLSGGVHSPIPQRQVVFGYQLSHVTLRLPVTSVRAVIVRTKAPETHLCIGRLTVGAPFAVGGSK